MNGRSSEFVDGMQFNQQKMDQRLSSAIHRAYTYNESNQFIKGMTVALRVIRGEQYDRKLIDLDSPNYEKLKDD